MNAINQPKKIEGQNRKLPVYIQLSNHLMSEIQAGKYPVGTLMPTEQNLSDQYGISRHTVREALRRLREVGLISRRQGAGTYVEALQTEANYHQQVGSLEDLSQYTRNTRLEILSVKRIKADTTLAVLLSCQKDAEWIYLDCIRQAFGIKQPICLVKVYILPEFDRLEKELHNRKGTIPELIEDMYGFRIAEIRQTISAVVPNLNECKALGVEPGSPALKTIRSYYDEKRRMLELSVSIHPADRFTYTMRFRPKNLNKNL